MFASPTLKLQRGRRRSLPLWMAFPVLLAGCEEPTFPRWDTTWVVPAESASISVNQLLPSTITVPAGGSVFQLNLQPVSVSQTLGQLCGSVCNSLNGFTVPKPALDASIPVSISLPSEVVSANLQGGQINVAISHNFPFDLLQPAGTSARGKIVIRATSGSTTVAYDSIPGETTSFSAGTLNRTLTLATATITGPIDVSVRVVSPAGGNVAINTSNSLSVAVTPNAVQISQAQVRVPTRTITATQVDLDLGDVDEAVTERTKGGALLLDIVNPFSVTGNLNIVITTPTGTINKQVQLQTGNTSVRVDFTQQEIQSILGANPVRLTISGTVSAPSTGTVVRPSQVVSVRSRILLTIGGKED